MGWREKLIRLRAMRRLSQADVARAVGLPQSSVGRWESGKGSPTLMQGYAIARALDVPLDFLADDSVDEVPDPNRSEIQARILWLAEQIGYDLAVKRLAAANETTPAPPLKGEPGLINMTVRKDLRGVVIPEIKPKDRTPDGDPEPTGSGKGKKGR